MNRTCRRIGLVAALAGSIAPMAGCEWIEKQSAEFQAFLFGAGAGLTAGLLAAALGADTEEAILIGVLAGAAVGATTYIIAKKRQSSREENARIEAEAQKAASGLPKDVARTLEQENRLLAIPYEPPAGTPAAGSPGEPVQEYVLVRADGTVVKEDGETATVFAIPEEKAKEAIEAQSNAEQRRFARIDTYDVVILPKPTQG
ncbi:MAG: hypothetical protein KF866_11195 [Phycisphaeraceae bacterium]|nr:hypothetical protein [Phycisphaeraceae bacterium]MCW5754259.1 hypothetical protein [Phycisphaeraceae bacterium]